MAEMTKDQEARLNLAAGQWLGGHFRNFRRSMNPRNNEPMEPVAPWGEARKAIAAAPPPASVVPASAGGEGTPERPQDAPQRPNVPTLINQSKVAVAGGAQAAQPAAEQQQAFRSLLGNGITMTGDMQGNRTYTMGTHGQDGYGRMVVPGGQNAMAAQNLVGGRPQAQSPYSFDGPAEDRARFMRQPTRPAMQDGNTVANERPIYQQVRDRHNGAAGMEAPKYLGPESGLGWKTRLAKYNAELDAYEKLTGQKTAMDIAAMREAGAGRQSELQAKGVNDANEIARQRLAGDQRSSALDQQAKQIEIQQAQQRQQIINRLDATTDPNERRMLQSQLLAMQGKDPAQKYQVVTREGFDPVTNMPTKTPYAVNQDDPTQSFEISGQPTSRNYEAAPRDVKARIPGQVYVDAQGRPVRWDGQGFKLAE
jgi:hypothetical protein